MIRRLIVAAAVLTSALSTTVARAQDNWVLMGSQRISLNKDTETIDVTAAKGSFSAIRIVAKGHGIDVSNVEVVYNDGASHNERRPIHMLTGERTRAIDPQPAGRFVNRVSLTFKPEPGQQSIIEVQGLQPAALARAVRTTPVATIDKPPVTGIVPAKPTSEVPVAAKPGAAVSSTEVLFGAGYVGFLVDRDAIRVGADVGKFDKVRLRVLDNDLHINSMKVIYSNGETQEIAYDADVRKDTRTQWFDLKGDRFIKEIQMIYRAGKANVRGQAYVEVYGQFAEGWTVAERKKFNAGAELLGAVTAGFGIDRSEIIKVGRGEGGLKSIEVRVRDEAIILYEVKVNYTNGDSDIIPANRTKIEAGGRFGPIDLKGGDRMVDEIRMKIRTSVLQQGGLPHGRAIVEYWGRH